MDNKEHIYEEKIKPLVDRIHDLAKEHGIPFITAFEVSETDIMGSYFLPEGCTCQQLELTAAIMEHGAPKVLMGLAVEQSMAAQPVKVHD
jgi:uncharacterized HAD superfamily protein